MTLVIEYVLEGNQRGYSITSPTHGISEDVQKAIWRAAMPRGSGWAAYEGARSVKLIMLPDDMLAVSEVTVTDQRDETGRGGIRRAVVELMTPRTYEYHLHSRWLAYPSYATFRAKALYTELSKSLPRPRKNSPLVLAYPYQSMQDWLAIEATLVMLMSDPPRVLRRLEMPIPFTSLALDHRGENPIIAMPAAHAGQISADVVVHYIAPQA
jgi:hypothetical protein